MNKIYRIIWNAAQQAWVVVSELAKGHVKSSSNQNNNDIVNEIKTSPKSTALFSVSQTTANAVILGGAILDTTILTTPSIEATLVCGTGAAATDGAEVAVGLNAKSDSLGGQLLLVVIPMQI